MELNKSERGNIYRIKLKETLEGRIAASFGDLTVTPLENGETLLVGPFADQPALRGFLDQLWNLNFTVLSVERIENGFNQEATL